MILKESGKICLFRCQLLDVRAEDVLRPLLGLPLALLHALEVLAFQPEFKILLAEFALQEFTEKHAPICAMATR